jgi:hypothetical protein
MFGLGVKDAAALAVGAALLLLHFALSGPISHLLSPWLISSVMVGWVFGKIALHHIDRSVESPAGREPHG